MTAAEQLRQALSAHAAKHGPVQTVLAVVTEVQELAGTCTVQDDDGPPWYGIRLTPAITQGKNFRIVPTVGCKCLMARIEGGEGDWWLMWAEQIEKWQLETDGVEMELDGNGLLLKKGTDTLKQIITLMIEAMQVVVVLQGNNPDYVKLTQAMAKANNLLK